MLVRSDHRAVDVMSLPIKLTLSIDLLLQCPQDCVPETTLGPAIEAGSNGGPRPVALGQVAPWSPSSVDPEHAVDHAAMVLSRAAALAAFGWSLRWKQWLQPLP